MAITLARWKAEKDRPVDEFICGTVFELEAIRRGHRELISEAIRAEIRERGGVNSIAPAEIEKLIDAHLKAHPVGRD